MKRIASIGAALAVAALLVWLFFLRGKGHAPQGPLTVSIHAAPASVRIGDSAALTAVVGGASRATYQWLAMAGHVEQATAAATRWTAPRMPGRYEIRVVVTDGDRQADALYLMDARLPMPGDPDFVRARTKTPGELAADRYAELQKRADEQRAIAAKRDTFSDHYAARLALEQLGAILIQMGELEEALEVYEELATGEMMGERWRKYQERLGYLKYMLGDTAGAMRDFKDGGPYTTGVSAHYMGTLQEQSGDLEGALASYQKAQRGARRDGEPVYREALLSMQLGKPRDEIAALLIEASPRIGGDQIVDRLQHDAELLAIWQLLQASGRIGELQPAGTIPALPDDPPTQPVTPPELPSREGVAPH